jgi:hypothetical protein
MAQTARAMMITLFLLSDVGVMQQVEGSMLVWMREMYEYTYH